jgi:hypothetical protein
MKRDRRDHLPRRLRELLPRTGRGLRHQRGARSLPLRRPLRPLRPRDGPCKRPRPLRALRRHPPSRIDPIDTYGRKAYQHRCTSSTRGSSGCRRFSSRRCASSSGSSCVPSTRAPCGQARWTVRAGGRLRATRRRPSAARALGIVRSQRRRPPADWAVDVDDPARGRRNRSFRTLVGIAARASRLLDRVLGGAAAFSRDSPAGRQPPCENVRRAGRLVRPDLSRARSVTVKRPGPLKRAAGSQCRV